MNECTNRIQFLCFGDEAHIASANQVVLCTDTFFTMTRNAGVNTSIAESTIRVSDERNADVLIRKTSVEIGEYEI